MITLSPDNLLFNGGREFTEALIRLTAYRQELNPDDEFIQTNAEKIRRLIEQWDISPYRRKYLEGQGRLDASSRLNCRVH